MLIKILRKNFSSFKTISQEALYDINVNYFNFPKIKENEQDYRKYLNSFKSFKYDEFLRSKRLPVKNEILNFKKDLNAEKMINRRKYDDLLFKDKLDMQNNEEILRKLYIEFLNFLTDFQN